MPEVPACTVVACAAKRWQRLRSSFHCLGFLMPSTAGSAASCTAGGSLYLRAHAPSGPSSTCVRTCMAWQLLGGGSEGAGQDTSPQPGGSSAHVSAGATAHQTLCSKLSVLAQAHRGCHQAAGSGLAPGRRVPGRARSALAAPRARLAAAPGLNVCACTGIRAGPGRCVLLPAACLLTGNPARMGQADVMHAGFPGH